MRKRPDIDISVRVFQFRGTGTSRLWGGTHDHGLFFCRRGTIMRYRTRTNGVSERLDEEPLGSGFFSCFVPAQRLRLTRYVRRVRELRQNVSSHTLCRSRFSLTVCFCSHTNLYMPSSVCTDTVASASPFVQTKLVRTPFQIIAIGACRARVSR